MAEIDKPQLLIAEDDNSSFLLLMMLLKKEYQITRAVNGAEAVKKVMEADFDVLLMDMRMPEMDGLEALRQIRKFNTTLPIIMQTANVFDTDKRASFQAGCNAFLTKPIVASQLKEVLKTVMGGGKSNLQEEYF